MKSGSHGKIGAGKFNLIFLLIVAPCPSNGNQRLGETKAITPLGRITRYISRNVAASSTTCSRTSLINTPSNDLSRKGIYSDIDWQNAVFLPVQSSLVAVADFTRSSSISMPMTAFAPLLQSTRQ